MSPLKEFRRPRPPGQPGAEPFKPQIQVRWTDDVPMGRMGINSQLAASEIRPDQASDMRNAKRDESGIRAAWGFNEIGSEVGESDTTIRNLAFYQTTSVGGRIVRITNDFLYFSTGGAWTQAALAAGAAMDGGVQVHMDSAMVQGDLLIAVPGEGALIRWQGGSGNGALTEISGSPANPWFVIPFADRAVVARTNSDEQLVQWCVSGDITDWSGIGAGNVSLIEDPETAFDQITGLSVQGELLIVYRQGSIWTGTRTGQPNPPIAFRPRLQGIGCLSPRTIANCRGAGDIFLGRKNIYFFDASSRDPVPIGDPIQDELFAAFDWTLAFHPHATFLAHEGEYWLFPPDADDATNHPTYAYVFDFDAFLRDGSLIWTRRDLDNLNPVSASFSMDTDDLTDPDPAVQRLVIGTTAGETFDSDTDDTTDDGSAITMQYDSPDFQLPDNWVQLHGVRLKYTAAASSTVGLAVSVDGGATYSDTLTYTLPASTGSRAIKLHAPRGRVGRAVRFRLTNTPASTNRPIFHAYSVGLSPRATHVGRYR